MNLFDQLYINVFKYHNKRGYKYANNLALLNVSSFQIGLVLILGVLFAEFSRQMNLTAMNREKAWALFIVLSVAVLFMNWMQYSGIKRNKLRRQLNKSSFSDTSIILLWILPIASIISGLVLYNLLQ